jgi:hypothetical protein
MTDIPTTEPISLRAGDTWKWTKTLSDYPATAWTLKYRFKHKTAAGFEIVASASGNDHSVSVAAATSTGYAPGQWTWQSWVEGGTSEKYSINAGILQIDPDYRSGVATNALDNRSHARKTLEAIEAWIESRNPGVEYYEIAGRQMRYIPIADLLKLRQLYKSEVAAEDASNSIIAGRSSPRKIQFRI